MEARLELSLFCYKPDCFSHVNDHDVKLVSIRTTLFTYEKEEGLCPGKVTSSLASTQRTDRLAHNCRTLSVRRLICVGVGASNDECSHFSLRSLYTLFGSIYQENNRVR